MRDGVCDGAWLIYGKGGGEALRCDGDGGEGCELVGGETYGRLVYKGVGGETGREEVMVGGIYDWFLSH